MSVEDRQLIAECLRGRTAAFGELVRRYQDRLYNAVFRISNSAEDAQDVVQEAFLSAYQALEGFKGQAGFFTWLYRIAMNEAISLKRKQRVRVTLKTQYEEEAQPEDRSAFSRPGEAAERAEEEKKLRFALHRLSPGHRAVLVLKDIEGLKYEEIAEAIQVPIGTIRSRLHRARAELREILEGLERNEPRISTEKSV